MPTAESIAVQVAYAWAGGSHVCDLRLPAASSVADALSASDLARTFPDLDLERAPVGIFSRKVARDHRLRDGDRIEIYRPLQIDPMQARRRRAGQGG